MAIDIGGACMFCYGWLGQPNVTVICDANPCNDFGHITQICMYVHEFQPGEYTSAMIEFKVLEPVGGNDFKLQHSVTALEVIEGMNVFNAPADFDSFTVEIGWMVGAYFATVLPKVAANTCAIRGNEEEEGNSTLYRVDGNHNIINSIETYIPGRGYKVDGIPQAMSLRMEGSQVLCPNPVASFTHSGGPCI